jgi:hypothetical protein
MFDVFANLDKRLGAELARWRAVVATDIPALDALAASENVPPVVVRTE